MGSMLDKPITEKETERGEANNMKYAASAMQGWRVEMEDAHTMRGSLSDVNLPDHAFFGVYDGHGGKYTAWYTGENIVNVFTSRPELQEYISLSKSERSTANGLRLVKAALTNTFLQLDERILSESEEERDPRDRSGCTCVVVFVTPSHYVCANAGDSRSLFNRGGQCIPLSFDHKPSDAEEYGRIERAGGYVSMRRVDGDLAVSRAIGDFQYKDRADLPPEEQKVTAKPDIMVYNREYDKDEFLLLACDGIWDVVTNDECSAMISQIFEEGESDIGTACEEVLDLCLSKNSRDNMTALLVAFPPIKIGQGEGVAGRRTLRALMDQMENESNTEDDDVVVNGNTGGGAGDDNPVMVDSSVSSSSRNQY